MEHGGLEGWGGGGGVGGGMGGGGCRPIAADPSSELEEKRDRFLFFIFVCVCGCDLGLLDWIEVSDVGVIAIYPVQWRCGPTRAS